MSDAHRASAGGPRQHGALAPDILHRAFNAAIWGQCFGVQPQLALARGLGLLYLHALAVPTSWIVVLLSSSLLVRGLLSIPAGFWADRAGKKRLGVAGQLLAIAGFALLTAAPWMPPGWPLLATVAVAIALFGAGTALFGAGWFALLSPLLPRSTRGRRLGRLRVSRQLAAIAFGGLVAMCMSEATPVAGFQVLFAGLTLCLVFRLLLYRRIPELERTHSGRAGFVAAIRDVLSISGYRRFCTFVPALFLAVGAVPMVFGLLELEVLAIGDALVWWLGLAMITGQLAGSLAGGRLVDRAGGRLVLMLSQVALIISMALLCTRGWGPPSPIWRALAASTLFGLAKSALELAVTAELLAKVPRANKALAVSFCGTLIYLGESLAGLLVAWALALAAGSLLPAAGWVSTSYDAVLMCLIALLAVLLPLTPFAVSRRQVVEE